MKIEDIKLDDIYWTNFFLRRDQGTDVQWRAVKVKVIKKITEIWSVGDHTVEKVKFQCRCEGYERPNFIPAVYWEGGMPEEYLKTFQYGDWGDHRCNTFSAEDLYPTVEDCIRNVYERFRVGTENLKHELERGDYKTFPGDLVIGMLPKTEGTHE